MSKKKRARQASITAVPPPVPVVPAFQFALPDEYLEVRAHASALAALTVALRFPQVQEEPESVRLSAEQLAEQLLSPPRPGVPPMTNQPTFFRALFVPGYTLTAETTLTRLRGEPKLASDIQEQVDIHGAQSVLSGIYYHMLDELRETLAGQQQRGYPENAPRDDSGVVL